MKLNIHKKILNIPHLYYYEKNKKKNFYKYIYINKLIMCIYLKIRFKLKLSQKKNFNIFSIFDLILLIFFGKYMILIIFLI
jgi:hypothetical protein